jgi:hypothetical protein
MIVGLTLVLAINGTALVVFSIYPGMNLFWRSFSFLIYALFLFLVIFPFWKKSK